MYAYPARQADEIYMHWCAQSDHYRVMRLEGSVCTLWSSTQIVRQLFYSISQSLCHQIYSELKGEKPNICIPFNYTKTRQGCGLGSCKTCQAKTSHFSKWMLGQRAKPAICTACTEQAERTGPYLFYKAYGTH